jgi:hypothetical protein
MRHGAIVPLTDLPAAQGWTYGGFDYGLEPLVLPAVTEPDALRDRAGSAPARGYADACRLVRALSDGAGPARAVRRDEVAEDVYWFRWVTGHQVCFVIWRLMGQLLDEVDQGRAPAAALEPMCRFVDGYSAMLLYTGSCPPELYRALIRPSMARWHRAFSGSWAPDYPRVRELLRGRPLVPMSGADAGELADSIKLHNLVHDGVSAKLVPDGRSLLTQAAVGRLNRGVIGMIYDSYFMTLRLPVARHQVVAQLLRRLVAIVQDIAVNGLHAGNDRSALPEQFHTAEVVKCEKGLVEILFEVARFACGLAPPGPVRTPDHGPRAGAVDVTGP